MPQPTSGDTRLFTVTADTLVAVDFTPRAPREPGPYRRLFAVPGARAFTAGNLLARLPMGMFGVSAIVMIAGSRGSYALAAPSPRPGSPPRRWSPRGPRAWWTATGRPASRCRPR